MSEKQFINSPENLENKNFDVLDFLAKLGEVTSEDITKFRDFRVMPERRDYFDSLPKETIIPEVAIDLLPDSEIDKLIEVARDPNYNMLGLHKIRSKLRHLFGWTKDPRYSSNRYLNQEQ